MDITEVKRNLNKPVKLDNTEYVLKECVMWLSEVDKEIKYSVTLIDKNGNSTLQTALERVEIIKGD